MSEHELVAEIIKQLRENTHTTPAAPPAAPPEDDGNKLTFAWLAGILLTIVLGSGAWFTSTLNSKVDVLGERQAAMSSDIAVIKNQVGTILKESK